MKVIFVEDGSYDNSWHVVDELTRRFAWARGIRLMRNYGQHNALLCGIRAAQPYGAFMELPVMRG
ncbi:MAG: hypothetical protein DCC55_38580 [Chloroflexi bacterium]|nr:MAG: hypothetical protein DCC55_38580 [Chloroflexota bacterium]